jgi:hypothetical protein
MSQPQKMTASGNLAFWEANGLIKVIKLNRQAFFECILSINCAPFLYTSPL